jgi:hypothetical protein
MPLFHSIVVSSKCFFSREAMTARMHACMLADRRTVHTGSETFLALLQLFQQAEVTRYFCAHGCVFVGCDWERFVVSIGASLRLLGQGWGSV